MNKGIERIFHQRARRKIYVRIDFASFIYFHIKFTNTLDNPSLRKLWVLPSKNAVLPEMSCL